MKRPFWNIVASALISSCADRSVGDNYIESRADAGIPDIQYSPDSGAAEDLNTLQDARREKDVGIIDASADTLSTRLPCGTMEWFLEYEDPFSKRFFDETYPSITANYGERVSFSYRHFPLDFHIHARAAAEAVECAKLQERFFDYHSRLFSSQEEWRGAERSDAVVRRLWENYAVELGLEMEQFNSCVEWRETASIVDADIAEGTARGIEGIPTFFIGEETIVGAQPYDVFARAIDAALEDCED